jgi:hypothetical protein
VRALSRTSGSIETVRLKARTYDQSRFYHYPETDCAGAEISIVELDTTIGFERIVRQQTKEK